MTDPCITCGGDVGEPIPALVAAKKRFGMPIKPAKRCPKCVWTSLLAFAASPDDEEDPRTEAAKT